MTMSANPLDERWLSLVDATMLEKSTPIDRLPLPPASQPLATVAADGEVLASGIDGLYQLAFELAPSGLALVGADGRLLSVNRAMCRLLGGSADVLTGMTLQAIADGDANDPPFDFCAVRAWLTGRSEPVRLERRFRRAGRASFWGQLDLTLASASPGMPVAIVAQLQDIDERRWGEERLRHAALHDWLTGLPNRALFEERLDAVAAKLDDGLERIALLFIDLNDFKVVNDRYGHMVGDGVLRTVGGRLRACLRGCDTVARYGGDEFTVLLEDVEGANEAQALAGRIVEALARPMEVGGHLVQISVSVGVSMRRSGDLGAVSLRDADAAMYRAKGTGRAVG